MRAIELNIPDWQTEHDLAQADDVRISDSAFVRADGYDVELASMQFGFPAANATGGPVLNFRSEGRRFVDSKRCLIPASAFFEFTGKSYPKTEHRFTLNDAPFNAIAGLWREGKGNQPPAFTMLITEPRPDIVSYHHRQIVVLRPEDWAAWLRLSRPEDELLRHLPAGSLAVETARRPEKEVLDL